MAEPRERATFAEMKSKPISRPPFTATPSRPPTHEQIHALAHALWVDRGCPVGRDIDIWLDAERQLGGGTASLGHGERVDVETSDAARVDRELDRIVSPPEQRSPTAL
jgi:hypothetical protein